MVVSNIYTLLHGLLKYYILKYQKKIPLGTGTFLSEYIFAAVERFETKRIYPRFTAQRLNIEF